MLKVIILASALISSFSYAKVDSAEVKKAVKKYLGAGTYAGVDCSVRVEFAKAHTLVSVHDSDSGLNVQMRVRSKKDNSITMNAAPNLLTLENIMEDGDEANGAYTITEAIQISQAQEGQLEVYAFSSYDYESGKDSDYQDVTCRIKK